MTECPTCKLAMESHSTSELMECCMKQVGEEFTEEQAGICPTASMKFLSIQIKSLQNVH